MSDATTVNKDHTVSEYVLDVGRAGAYNLDLQHEILKDESFIRLKEAGLSEGMIVWDIGCGSGTMTEYLAKTVGRDGTVYAMDASLEQIGVTKAKLESAGLDNVQFVVGKVDMLDSSIYPKADIVYSRLLLMHVRDHTKTIQSMASVLKSGGALSLQESSMDAAWQNINDPYIQKYYSWIIKYGNDNGFDYSIGRKLKGICEATGLFSEVRHYTKNYKTTDKIKELVISRSHESKKKIIASGIASEDEVLELQNGIEDFLRSDRADNAEILSEQSYIVAIKK